MNGNGSWVNILWLMTHVTHPKLLPIWPTDLLPALPRGQASASRRVEAKFSWPRPRPRRSRPWPWPRRSRPWSWPWWHRENSSSSSDAAHEFHTSPWPYCVSKNAPTLTSCCFDKHNVWNHVKVLQNDKKNWRIMQLLRQTILETVYLLYYCFN